MPENGKQQALTCPVIPAPPIRGRGTGYLAGLGRPQPTVITAKLATSNKSGDCGSCTFTLPFEVAHYQTGGHASEGVSFLYAGRARRCQALSSVSRSLQEPFYDR